MSFQATAHGSTALLTWTTAQELDNDYFEAEVSADGRAFSLVGRVTGNGTTSTAHSYSLQDEQLLTHGVKLVYYRLRQVDRDGSSHYSPVRVVSVSESTDNSFAVYPTVLASGEALRYTLGGAVIPQAEGAELTLYALTGQRLSTQQLPAGATGKIEMPTLPGGWYLARLRLSDGQVLTAHFGMQ
jgi:hypothetical protein